MTHETPSAAGSAPANGSPARPHIKIVREQSSWDGWCVHYAGFFDRDAGDKKKTHCDAGVEYATVIKAVDFTYSYSDQERPYESKQAHPCFKREHHLTDGCPQCRFPSRDEIAERRKRIDVQISGIATARHAILKELRRRFKDDRGFGITAPVDISRFCKPQPNYFCGAGVMDCPVCGTGKLQYSRAAYNGHVHARCSTAGCVSWME